MRVEKNLDRTTRLRPVARLGLGAALALLSISACSSGGSKASSSSSPATSGSSSVSTTSSTSTSTTTTTKPSASGAAETINDTTFPAPFTVAKPAGWTSNNFGHPNDVLELCPEPECKTELGITNPVGATPKEVADHIAAAGAPYVVGPATTGTVNGLPATQFDIELPATTGSSEGSDGPPLFLTVGGGAVGLVVGNTGRLSVIDLNGKPYTILIEAPSARFADFRAQAESVLESLQFT